MDIEEVKRDARRAAAAARHRLHGTRVFGCGERLRDGFLAGIDLPAGGVVSGYWPFRDEIDVVPLMVALHDRGHPIALPVLDGPNRPLIFRRWSPGDALHAAEFGLEIPAPEAPVLTPEILLTPLLAFDAEGFRLGYGGGYYDRTIAGLRAGAGCLAIGVAYAGQRVERVVRDAHDEPLDWVASEAGAIRIGEADRSAPRSGELGMEGQG